MEAIAFELSGKTAFFKKPDVNEYAYFTYSHIHKIALLGLLGSVLGLSGYWQQYESLQSDGETEQNRYPEFFERLHSISVSIVPHGDRGYFAKKIQAFNNSVGYASQEAGGNLIVREQWLENPYWTIYLLQNNVSSDIYNHLKKLLLNRQSTYIPYLGKNDHPARISGVRVIKLENQDVIDGINSLFPVDEVEFARRGTVDEVSSPYYFSEWMPVDLTRRTNHYRLRELAHTNKRIQEVKDKSKIFQTEMKTLYFI
ncbi:type I-B CRISPR-associated protein Cas5b [Sporolactobacillus sp. STCC-11]|uniref:type I-B CRISPR-associated protein Cas5b n=1 Tax=Sporolactobacillus caesalpiniae TaxID=3230362 RepID=UPI003397F64D